MLIFLKNSIKYGKTLRNFERIPPFCNNIACITKIKTLSSYSEDCQHIKIPRKELIYKFSSIAILYSVSMKRSKC